MALSAPTTTLTGQTIASSYDQLLFLDAAAGVTEATLKIVSGTAGKTALQISDEHALIKGVDTNNAAAFEVQQTDATSILKVAADTPAVTIGGTLTASGITKVGTAAGSGADAYLYTAGTAAHVGIHWDADLNTEGTLVGGADDHGVDFKFFGETAGSYIQWDMSDDQLKLVSSSIDMGDGYILNEQGRQNHVGNTMPSPSYYTGNHANAHIMAPASAIYPSGNEDRTLVAWVYPVNMFNTYNCIGSLGVMTENDAWYINIDGSDDNKIHISHYQSEGGVDQTGSNRVQMNQWNHVAVSFSGSAYVNKIYINGVLDSTVAPAGATPLTTADTEEFWISTRDGTNYPFNGNIADVKLYNMVLSDTEIKDLYSGGDVPFKHKGANKTSVVTGDNSDFDTVGSWVAYVNGTVSVVANFSGGSGSGVFKYIWGTGADGAARLDSQTTKGKRYRVTFDAKVASGATAWAVANSRSATATLTGDNNDGVAFTFTTSQASYSGEFTATGENIYISQNPSNSTSASTIYIDDFKITPIGAVAEYDGSTVGHNQWLDKSGNELHGTTSNTLLQNLPSWHREMYIDLTVTGDTSFTLPKGYRISSITTKETAGNAVGGGIDFGTTNGGGEVVAAHAISASTTADVAVAAILNNIGGTHTTADDIIYITDADGSGWDSASVEIRVSMERVSMY